MPMPVSGIISAFRRDQSALRSAATDALRCIALHCIVLRCVASHCIALHCAALRCVARNASSLGYLGVADGLGRRLVQMLHRLDEVFLRRLHAIADRRCGADRASLATTQPGSP